MRSLLNNNGVKIYKQELTRYKQEIYKQELNEGSSNEPKLV